MPENDKLLGILQRIAALPEPNRNAFVENIGHTVRDNTRVAVNPGDVGFIPNSEDRNPDRDVRLDDGIMGFMPVIGDALQAGQAVKDASEGKWGRAALGAGLLLAPNIIAQPIKSIDKAIVKAVDDVFSPATQTLRRKMTRGQLMKILDENGAIRPLVREGENLRFTKQKPRKAQYYIETDVPVKGVLEPEAFPEDMFADGSPFSKRFIADDGFTPNIYDDNVHIYERVPGGGYREVLKDELVSPDMAEYGIGSTRDIRTEKPIRLSEHRIHVPESPVQTVEGNTFYLDEVSSPGFDAKLKPYQKRDRLYVDSGFSGTQNGGDITEILKSKINNVNEPSDVAKSMSESAKRYYSNNYDVAAKALTDDEWERLAQTLLEKEQAKGNEVFFHSTYKDFDKVIPEELNKVNAGFLGNGFYLSDIPQADYGPIVMPFSMPRGKQLVLSTRNGLKHTDYGFLHADNKEADELLTRLRRPMVRWTKNGFKADRYGVWPGMRETSKSPEAWNNFIKENDFNVIKSERSSKGIGYKYPEIVVPPDKVNLLEFLYKSPQDLRDGGPLLINPYAEGGGLSRSSDYKSSKKPYPSVKSGDFAGAGRSYPIPTKADAVDALRLAGLHHRPDVKAKVYAKYPSLKHANGGPLNSFPNGGKFITTLSPEREDSFMKDWQAFASLYNLARNPDDPEHYYDYRGFWDANKKSSAVNPFTWETKATDGHLPDTWKTPGHPTFSVESIYAKDAPGLAGHWEEGVYIPPEMVDQDAIKLRQRYAESAFNDKAKSGAGALGAFQIMPKTGEEYARRMNEKGDLLDPEYNERMRDYIWNDFYNSELASKGNPLDTVRTAKALAMYNWGRGNVATYLNNQKANGADIYGSLDWVEGLPKETRDYINFILLNKDVPDTSKTQMAFEKAAKAYGYSIGGRIDHNKLYKTYGRLMKAYGGDINRIKEVISKLK